MKQDTQRQDSFESYAIIQLGNHQYQAIPGKTLQIEQIDGQAGESVEFKEVLLKKDKETIQVGTPLVKGSVKATIVKQMKAPKVVVFRFKRRKKSRVKKGHRQPHTVVRIESI
ncbi:50S ribosomal protein L21 [Candidatus Babeliales bacterium]|nr:50S ribosomal protein L21 [Candidatus Babeliales bacterium]